MDGGAEPELHPIDLETAKPYSPVESRVTVLFHHSPLFVCLVFALVLVSVPPSVPLPVLVPVSALSPALVPVSAAAPPATVAAAPLAAAAPPPAAAAAPAARAPVARVRPVRKTKKKQQDI